MTPSPAQDHSRTEGLRESTARVIADFTEHDLPSNCLLAADQILALLTPSQSHDEEDARPESPSGLAPSEHEAGRSAEGAGGFTPGPWYVDDTWREAVGIFAGADDQAVAYLMEPFGGPSLPNAPANARLIAAAPEQHDALSGLLAWTGQFNNRELVQWLIAKRTPGFEQLTEDEWVKRLDGAERAGWSAIAKALQTTPPTPGDQSLQPPRGGA